MDFSTFVQSQPTKDITTNLRDYIAEMRGNAYDACKAIGNYMAQHGFAESNIDLMKIKGFKEEDINQYHAMCKYIVTAGMEEGIRPQSLIMIHYTQDKIDSAFRFNEYSLVAKPVTPTYTDEEKKAIGNHIAKIFKLKRDIEHRDRFQCGEGYSTKTAIGIFNMIEGFKQDLEKGTGIVKEAKKPKGMEM